MNKKIIKIALLTGVIVFIFLKYLSLFVDNTHIRKNSIEYFVLVPAIVKELPIEQWGKLIRYHHSNVDGTQSALNGVVFSVKQYPNKTLDKIKKYFISKQFKMIEERAQGLDLKNNVQSVSVHYFYDEKTGFYTIEIMFF